MTLQKFQSIVLRLSNQMPTRYFLFSFGEGVMAIQVWFRRNKYDDYSRLHTELLGYGFERLTHDNDSETWTILRTEPPQTNQIG